MFQNVTDQLSVEVTSICDVGSAATGVRGDELRHETDLTLSGWHLNLL
jgi:hypothetical protein